MIYSKTTPISEDKWIDRLLNSMQRILPSIWGVDSSQVLFYGRSDVIDGKDKWFTNGNFKDIETNSSYKFISFIRISDQATYQDGKILVDAKLVCQGNLKSLYPSITHRADAELRKDCIDVLLLHCSRGQFNGYNIINQDKIKDMQPFHAFELNFIITY